MARIRLEIGAENRLFFAMVAKEGKAGNSEVPVGIEIVVHIRTLKLGTIAALFGNSRIPFLEYGNRGARSCVCLENRPR